LFFHETTTHRFTPNKITGWWFGTFFICPYIGNVIIPTDFHIFQRGGSTLNQIRHITIPELDARDCGVSAINLGVTSPVSGEHVPTKTPAFPKGQKPTLTHKASALPGLLGDKAMGNAVGYGWVMLAIYIYLLPPPPATHLERPACVQSEH